MVVPVHAGGMLSKAILESRKGKVVASAVIVGGIFLTAEALRRTKSKRLIQFPDFSSGPQQNFTGDTKTKETKQS